MTTVKLVLNRERSDSENGFYTGMHFGTRQKIVNRVRWAVKAELLKLEEKPVFDFPVFIAVVCYFDSNPQDGDNVTRKLYIDALIKFDGNPHGIIPDDNPKYVLFSGSDSRMDKERPRVEILITDSIWDLVKEINVKR